MSDEKTRREDDKEDATSLDTGERTVTQDDADQTTETSGDSAVAGERIGPYRLLELLGQGGMGEVWLAEQRKPVRRKVAFKVIKQGMDTKQVVARFEAERQALAMMDHSAVAKVFDAGSTPRGRPYFVMEHVSGVPITEHCDRHKLSNRERLELMTLVCDGVQHAHQKAIIHRDLKPSNVLVSMQDDKPVPKIIDFGIAKATGQKLTEQTMHTQVGSMIGTPEYMSPEQADPSGHHVDTRSDVYSLGVMLYELLVGRLPFSSKELRAEGYEGIRHKICDVDPPRPSTRITRLTDAAEASAGNRRTSPRSLHRELSGDLDWITMKALEKEPARRYGSPSDLAADIRRYLRHEPITARPPSVNYRARKFVRRHRFGVALAASLSVALIAGTVGTAVGLVRARHETYRASSVKEFLVRMLTEAFPDRAQGKEVTIREAVDRAAQNVMGSFQDQPDIAAELQETIGNFYHDMAFFDESEAHLTRAVELYGQAYGTRDRRTIGAAGNLSRTLMDSGRVDEALSAMEELFPLFREVRGVDDPETLDLMQNLAMVHIHKEQFGRAEELLLELIDRRASVLGEDNSRYLASVNNLAGVYIHTERYDQAEPLFVKAMEVRVREEGERHPKALISIYNLGDFYGLTGRFAEGEPLIRRALRGFREVLGEDHPYTLAALDGLANNLVGQERPAEAEPLALENHRLREERFGADHAETITAGELLVRIYDTLGESAKAEAYRR